MYIFFLWQNVTAVTQKYVQEHRMEVWNVCAEMGICRGIAIYIATLN